MATMSVGDVVRLKSGGPKMTVTGTSAGAGTRGDYVVHWFLKDDSEAKRGVFPGEALTKVDD